VSARSLLGPVPALAVVLLAALLLAGCSSYSGTRSEKVRQWADQNTFVANHDQLVSDIGSLRKAVATGQAKIVRTVCGGFAYDVGTAYDTLPTPDQALTSDLNDADTVFLAAATTCGAVDSVHSAAMTRANREIEEGMGDLKKAQQVLASLGVQWRIRP